MLLRVLLGLVGLTVVATTHCTKFYRKDYTYNEQFDANYKLHWDLSGKSWGSAFLACDDEGATLFYPKTTNEWSVVKDLVGAMKLKPNVSKIFVGIHDEFGLGEFMTVDGLSTPTPLPERDQETSDQNVCVTMDIDTGDYELAPCGATDNLMPFVCKKIEKTVPFCPTIDLEYTYYEETKKCYKISQRKKSWTDALQTCFMEGGILAVITNSAEARVIKDKLERDTEYFVGFRRLSPNGGFYTVKGQQYGKTFYKNWRQNDYENLTENDCVVVEDSSNDELVTSTRNCLLPSPFVCEMVPKA